MILNSSLALANKYQKMIINKFNASVFWSLFRLVS